MVELDLVGFDVDAAGAVTFEEGEVDPVADLGAGDGGALEGLGKGNFDDGFILWVEDLKEGCQFEGSWGGFEGNYELGFGFR